MKVEEPNLWKQRSTLTWEEHHGPVPAGRIVHHEDRDTLNDSVGNLSCITRAEHMNEHRQEHETQRLMALRARKRT